VAVAAIPEPTPLSVPEPVAVAAGSDEGLAVPVPGAAESDEVAAVPAPIAVATGEPDDLTKIPGIGPKMAMALAASGITTYRQLADTDVAVLRAAITGAGMRVAPTLPSWPERAKALADSAA
jgi:predicted flap endonuclease-1-like 5' DNA nuclease